MKLLLDHCVPRPLMHLFIGHDACTAGDMGWDRVRNGKLLAVAAENGFGALITTDRRMKHQQNLDALPTRVVVLKARRNKVELLAPLVPLVLAALDRLPPGSLTEFGED